VLLLNGEGGRVVATARSGENSGRQLYLIGQTNFRPRDALRQWVNCFVTKEKGKAKEEN